MSKYIKGEPITSLDELMKQEFVYFNDRLINIGWYQNWQIGWANRYILPKSKCKQKGYKYEKSL